MIMNYLPEIGIALTIGITGNVLYNTDLVSNCCWNMVKKYHTFQFHIKQYMTTFNDDKNFENNDLNLIEYNLKTKEEIIYPKINHNQLPESYKKQSSFLLSNKKLFFINKMINKTNYFKRAPNENFCIEPIKKCFLSVELILDKEKINITDNLNSFYLINNSILDENFMKWFFWKYYEKDLPENYSIQLLDNNVNMLSINKTQYINLIYRGNNEDKYIIKKRILK
jgi:hypothetical protein